MKQYVELDANNVAFAEIYTEGLSGSAFVDVTGRTDGPWMGKQYDAGQDAFHDYDAFANAPEAVIQITDNKGQAQEIFQLTDELQIHIAVSGFNGTVIVDIQGPGGIAPTLFSFASGQASRSWPANRSGGTGLSIAGRYVINQAASPTVKIPAKTFTIVM